MYRSLRAAFLGSPSWAVMVGRERMRMQERVWWPEPASMTYDDSGTTDFFTHLVTGRPYLVKA